MNLLTQEAMFENCIRQDAARLLVRTFLHVRWLMCGTLCKIRFVSAPWLVSVSPSKILICVTNPRQFSLSICLSINQNTFIAN